MTAPRDTPGGPGRRAGVRRVPLHGGAVVLHCAAPPSRLAALVVAVPLPAGAHRARDLLAALWQHRAAHDPRLDGTRVEPLVTPDCVGLRVEAPAARFAVDALPLPPPPDVPANPDELAALRRSCAARRSPGAFDLLRATLFGTGHPYGAGVRERGEAAASSTDAELRSWAAALTLAPPAVAVCGAPAALAERLCERLDAAEFGPVPDLPPAALPHTARPPFRIAVPGRRARYLMGAPGAALGAPHKPAVHVAWAVLAGRDGLLDQRLRRERAMTYSLAAFSREFARGGYCACAAECDPAAVDDVREVTAAALAELAHGAVGAAELERARQRLTVQYHLAGQACRDVATRACCYEVAGVPAEDVADYPAGTAAVSAADVRRAIELFITCTPVEIVLSPLMGNVPELRNGATTTVIRDVSRSDDS